MAEQPKDEERGFVIRDRRGKGEEAPSASSASATAASSARASQSRAQAEAPSREPGPPVNFASFVFSLGSSALMLLGEKLDPQANVPVNLPQAKEIIDILSMLEAKTKGNLTAEEKEVLESTLYALRIKYVDLASKGPGRS